MSVVVDTTLVNRYFKFCGSCRAWWKRVLIFVSSAFCFAFCFWQTSSSDVGDTNSAQWHWRCQGSGVVDMQATPACSAFTLIKQQWNTMLLLRLRSCLQWLKRVNDEPTFTLWCWKLKMWAPALPSFGVGFIFFSVLWLNDCWLLLLFFIHSKSSVLHFLSKEYHQLYPTFDPTAYWLGLTPTQESFHNLLYIKMSPWFLVQNYFWLCNCKVFQKTITGMGRC